jgi:hypothetical protein
VRPGDSLTIEAGQLTLELDAIDEIESQAHPGARYVPLTPALWTWFAAGNGDPQRSRYLLAAARRLDAAARQVHEIEMLRDRLTDQEAQAYALRRTLFALIGAVEVGVIALGRACDMVRRASDLIGSTTEVPGSVNAKWEALNAIRNAYEHIEDRALGQVQRRPHPDALTIFDQVELLTHNRVTYGPHALELGDEIPSLIVDVRAFLKKVAGGDERADARR